jgi:ABC-type uncharacterized transport system substrate-binding protein
MRKTNLLVLGIAFLLAAPLNGYAKGRILFVDSYHAGYDWSDKVTEGVNSVLQDKDVQLRIFRMDTKRNPSEGAKKRAALDAKAVIEAFNPDVVIASDDSASKYLVMPYYKNASLPIVFCGVNHNTDAYGYPYKNATGMVEVTPTSKLVYTLKHFRRSEKIALLIGNSLTDQKDVANYDRVIKLPLDVYHVNDFDEWKMTFTRIQQDYDVMIMGNTISIKGWDATAAENVVLERTRIPTGCDLEWLAPFTFIAYTRVPQEQGRWAAQTALKIIDGAAPNSIPVTKNKEGNLIVNLNVAKAAGLKVTPNFLRKASRVIE